MNINITGILLTKDSLFLMERSNIAGSNKISFLGFRRLFFLILISPGWKKAFARILKILLHD